MPSITEAQKIAWKKYYSKHCERIKKESKTYYLKNRKKIKKWKEKYYLRNCEKIKKNSRKHYLKNRNKMRKYSRDYYSSHLKEAKKYHKEYCQNYKSDLNKDHREYYQAIRQQILNHYGNKCACCGEQRNEFLAIDHINGERKKTFKRTKKTKGTKKPKGITFYLWIIRNKFPNNLRILCHNCNSARGYYGYCPHEKERNEAEKIKCDCCGQIKSLIVETIDKNYRTNKTNIFKTFECSHGRKDILLNGIPIENTKHFKLNQLNKLQKQEEINNE